MQASAFFNLEAVKAQIDEAINNDAGNSASSGYRRCAPVACHHQAWP
jgi:hypothetical protein